MFFPLFFFILKMYKITITTDRRLIFQRVVVCSTRLCSGKWSWYQPPPGFPWILRQKTQTHSCSISTCLLGTIAGHYYLSPGKLCPYQFFISVSLPWTSVAKLPWPPTCRSSLCGHSVLRSHMAGHLFSIRNLSNPDSSLESPFSSRDLEVLTVPFAQQLTHGFLYWQIKN